MFSPSSTDRKIQIFGAVRSCKTFQKLKVVNLSHTSYDTYIRYFGVMLSSGCSSVPVRLHLFTSVQLCVTCVCLCVCVRLRMCVLVLLFSHPRVLVARSIPVGVCGFIRRRHTARWTHTFFSGCLSAFLLRCESSIVFEKGSRSFRNVCMPCSALRDQ